MPASTVLPHEVAVIVFAREPVPGRVKTRLAASLPSGPADPRHVAAELYAACLTFLFQTLAGLPFSILPFITPDSSPAWFSRLVSGPVFIQRGEDLGERMRDAFLRGFAHFENLLLIGSDLPQLRPDTLRAAYAALATHDCVLGPAWDGGYYLIGFRKSSFQDCFCGVAWSTDTVLTQTLDLLAGRRVYLLESYRDLDDAADLEALLASEDCPVVLREVLRSRGRDGLSLR